MRREEVDDADWSPEEWSSFDALATATIEKHAQLRRIIPEGPSAPNAYVVELPRFDSQNLSFEITKTSPVTPVRVDFVVRHDQLHDQARIRQLVQRAAMRFAWLEDTTLAHGSLPRDRARHRDSRDPSDGLFDLKRGETIASTPSANDIIEALSQCVRRVRRQGYTGPLHAAFGFDAHATLAQDAIGHRLSGLVRAAVALGSAEAGIAVIPPDALNVGATALDREAALRAAAAGAAVVATTAGRKPSTQRDWEQLAEDLSRIPSLAAAAAVRARRAASLRHRDGDVVVFVPDPAVIDLVWARRPRLVYVGAEEGDMHLRLEAAFLLRLLDQRAIVRAEGAETPEHTIPAESR